MHTPPWLAAAGAALLLAAGPAGAQDFYDSVRLGAAPREGGRAGAALAVGRAYKGSDESRTALLPLVEYRWASGWFAGVGSGVGYEFLRETTTTAAVRLTPDFGRRESRSAALAGMGDIGARPEIGLTLNHALAGAGIGLHGGLRYGAGGDGLLADAGVAWGLPLAPTVRLRLGATATLANAAYMQTFFGVSDTQAASSGYAPYRAGAGLRDTRLSATLLVLPSAAWAVTAGLGLTTLHGDAADSPLTRERSSLTATATLSFAF